MTIKSCWVQLLYTNKSKAETLAVENLRWNNGCLAFEYEAETICIPLVQLQYFKYKKRGEQS